MREYMGHEWREFCWCWSMRVGRFGAVAFFLIQAVRRGPDCRMRRASAIQTHDNGDASMANSSEERV